MSEGSKTPTQEDYNKIWEPLLKLWKIICVDNNGFKPDEYTFNEDSEALFNNVKSNLEPDTAEKLQKWRDNAVDREMLGDVFTTIAFKLGISKDVVQTQVYGDNLEWLDTVWKSKERMQEWVKKWKEEKKWEQGESSKTGGR